MNVLFLAGGRRVSLAERFIKAGFKVYAYELSDKVPISSVAEIIIGKSWDKEYILSSMVQHINEAIEINNIDLVIPLMDKATTFMPFLDPRVKRPSPLALYIDTCFDKAIFDDFMMGNFMDLYPFLDLSENLTYPIIAKPRYGFGSKGIKMINTMEEFHKLAISGQLKSLVLQKYIKGQEYSVDAYFTPSSYFEDCVPRKRIRVADGEVITSITEKNLFLMNQTKAVGEKLRLVGPTNFQYIIDKNSNMTYLIEINCRFGGGCTLSMEAGLDMISLIKRDYFSIPYKYKPLMWKDNFLMERAYRDYYFENE